MKMVYHCLAVVRQSVCDCTVTTVDLDTPLSATTKYLELIGERGEKDNYYLIFSFKVSLSFPLPSEPLKF